MTIEGNFNYTASLAQSGIQALGGSNAKGGGDSWLVALAKAMGEMLGDIAVDMQKSVKTMESVGKDSKEFTVAQTKFQAESQLFSMMSNSVSTAIKAIGEGMIANARKT